MKQLVIATALILGSTSLFAAQAAGNSFLLRCEIANHTPVQKNLDECPSLVKSALDKMGCGGQVKVYARTSPGAPYSSVDLSVEGSTCSVPLKQKNTRVVCADKSSKLLQFRDYDQADTYNSQISTLVIEGLASQVRYLCSK